MTADVGSLLERIDDALTEAETLFERFDRSDIRADSKVNGDPVTDLDIAIDATLREVLVGTGEGWLSEETADDLDRLERELVWIVDPLDGTREFVDGLPEYATSIAAVVNGRPVAGGITNPAAGLRIIGAEGMGVRCNGDLVTSWPNPSSIEDFDILASRSEHGRGTWETVSERGLDVIPMGSVAYKFARVAAGLNTITWTPVPKHEWDIAGGAALIAASGGQVLGLSGETFSFNRVSPWLPGAIAMPPGLERHLDDVLKLVAGQLG